jgi:hypothetical protein
MQESTARMPQAWAVRNCRQLGPLRRGAGGRPAWTRMVGIVALTESGYGL